MNLSFDKMIDRSEQYSAKWGNIPEKSGIIPMSVADMDLPSASLLTQQLEKSARSGIYGYTLLPANYSDVVKNYLLRHYQYDVTNEDILFCPRVIQAISIYIREFTRISEHIGIFTPSYSPILNAILYNQRILEPCELIYQNEKCHIDFEKLEQCFQRISTFILISPHNPTGIVWSRDELQKIADLAEKYQVFIISDDVHADFDFSRNKHIIISTLNRYVENHSMICTSPAKTFNIPGLEIANIIIANPEVRTKFKQCMLALGMHNPQFFAVPAIMSAYQFCDDWIEQLRIYIRENRQLTIDFFAKEIPELKVTQSEGTFLLWINYAQLNINEDRLKHWFIDLSNIEVSWGSDFFTHQPFFRINIALPRTVLQESLRKLKQGFILLQKEDCHHE